MAIETSSFENTHPIPPQASASKYTPPDHSLTQPPTRSQILASYAAKGLVNIPWLPPVFLVTPFSPKSKFSNTCLSVFIDRFLASRPPVTANEKVTLPITPRKLNPLAKLFIPAAYKKEIAQLDALGITASDQDMANLAKNIIEKRA